MKLFLLSLIFGIVGGILRARELRYAFITGDYGTAGTVGLSIPWHWTTVLMITLTAVFAAILLVLIITNKHKDKCNIPQSLPFMMRLLAGAILFGTAAYEAYLAIISEPRVNSDLLYALLFLLAAFALLNFSVRGLNDNEKQYSLAYLIPVFWSCFLLMNTFFQHAANPVTNSYIYGLLSDISLALVLFVFAGVYFGQYKPKTFKFMGAIAVFFGTVSFMSLPLFRWAGHTFDTLPYVTYARTFSRESLLISLGIFAFTALFGASLLLADVSDTKSNGKSEVGVTLPPVETQSISNLNIAVDNLPETVQNYDETEDISMQEIDEMIKRLGLDISDNREGE